MSGPRLAVTVQAMSPKGNMVTLGPDSKLPSWAYDVIDHPRAWEGGVVPSGAPAADAGEAVKPAANASTAEWRAYALAQGRAEGDLDGLSRDGIRALFD